MRLGQKGGAEMRKICLRFQATGILFFVLAATAGVVACGGGNGAESASGLLPSQRGMSGSPSSPISHVIVVIQENRSFDDFFATFPNANGTRTGFAKPMPSDIASLCAKKGQPVITKATSVPLTEVSLTGKGFPTTPPTGGPFGWDNDLPHEYQPGYLLQCDSANHAHPSTSNPCLMDGFDVTKFGPNGEGPQATCTYEYQYVNPSDIKPYWDMAKQYVLADNAFQTQGSESFTAHQDLIAAGTAIDTSDSVIDDPTGFPWGCDAQPPGSSVAGARTSLLTTAGKYLLNKGPFPCYTQYQTIRDLLDAKSISWKFYATQVFVWHNPKAGNAGIWSAFDAIKNVRYSKEWGTNVTWPPTKIFKDINKGTLPAVSWVTPDGANSDHPDEKTDHGAGHPIDTGPSWVTSIVNAIGESKYWNSSAIVVLWDDWGGYYDHVPPPFYDQQGGLGFRLPLLIISPYVKAHVEHTQYETASVLKFIETNWNLPSLGQEDGRATSLGSAFDFSMPPRPFKKISSKYSTQFFIHQKPSGVAPDSD